MAETPSGKKIVVSSALYIKQIKHIMKYQLSNNRWLISKWFVWYQIDFFMILVVCWNFLNFVWTLCYSVQVVLTIFLLQTHQIEIRLVAIKSDYFSPKAYTPFHFSRTPPLRNKYWISLFIKITFFVGICEFLSCYYTPSCPHTPENICVSDRWDPE